MTIGQWIAQYCTQHNITIPTGMGEYNTIINWLILQQRDNSAGGDPDIDTATLDVVISPNIGLRLLIPVCMDDDVDVGTACSPMILTSGSYKIPLYKGVAVGVIGNVQSYPITVDSSGDVEISPDNTYVRVSGNGSVSITNIA